MITKEAIDKAILAHGNWKKRLKESVENSAVSFDISRASTDNNCEFGKWLYGDTITDAEKTTGYYTRVKDLHAEFHRTIKDVADLIMAGKKDEAKNMITDFNGVYSRISTKLVLLLAEWEKSL